MDTDESKETNVTIGSDSSSVESVAEPVKAKRRGRGRPKKSEIAKAKTPGKVGRPIGTAGIIKEYTARMIASPKSESVMAKIFDAALDDDHKHQAAAWKLLMDRLAPVSAIEQEVLKTGGKPSININITGLNSPKVDQDDPIDGEFTNV